MSQGAKYKVKASKGIYILMAISMAGVSSIPVFFKVLLNRKAAVATVNGLPITAEEYRYAVSREERVLAAYRERLGNEYRRILAMLGRSDRAEDTALEQLIIEKLLLGVADQIPLELSPTYVSIELAQQRTLFGVLGEVIPPYLITESGLLRVDVLRRFLQVQGLTFQHFELMVEQLLKEQLIMRLVQSSVIVSKAELDTELVSQFSTRELLIESLPVSAAQKNGVSDISDQELEAFYEGQNRLSSRYWSPERRSGTVWSFDLSNFEGNEQVTAEQLFLHEASSVTQEGSQKALLRFIEKYHGKQGTLKKVQRTEDAASTALFEVESPEGLGTGAAKGRGYIVKLEELISREQIPLATIRDDVLHDLQQEKARVLARESLKSGQATQLPGYKEQTIIIDPGQLEEADKALALYGRSSRDVRGLIRAGQSLHGMNKDVAYKMKLVRVDAPQEALIKKAGGLGHIKVGLWERRNAVVGRNFIASLRDHAILSVHTIEQRAS